MPCCGHVSRPLVCPLGKKMQFSRVHFTHTCTCTHHVRTTYAPRTRHVRATYAARTWCVRGAYVVRTSSHSTAYNHVRVLQSPLPSLLSFLFHLSQCYMHLAPSWLPHELVCFLLPYAMHYYYNYIRMLSKCVNQWGVIGGLGVLTQVFFPMLISLIR